MTEKKIVKVVFSISVSPIEEFLVDKALFVIEDLQKFNNRLDELQEEYDLKNEKVETSDETKALLSKVVDTLLLEFQEFQPDNTYFIGGLNND